MQGDVFPKIRIIMIFSVNPIQILCTAVLLHTCEVLFLHSISVNARRQTSLVELLLQRNNLLQAGSLLDTLLQSLLLGICELYS